MTYDNELLQEARRAGLNFDSVILTPQNEMVFVQSINGEPTEMNLREIPSLIDIEINKLAQQVNEMRDRITKTAEKYGTEASYDLPERNGIVLDAQIQFVMAQKRLEALKDFDMTIEFLLKAWVTNRFVIIDESATDLATPPTTAHSDPSSRSSTEEESIPIDLYRNAQADLHNAFILIKKLRSQKIYAKRPTKEALQLLVDQTRKKNGTINYSALSKLTHQTDKTLKRWCLDYGIK